MRKDKIKDSHQKPLWRDEHHTQDGPGTNTASQSEGPHTAQLNKVCYVIALPEWVSGKQLSDQLV